MKRFNWLITICIWLMLIQANFYFPRNITITVNSTPLSAVQIYNQFAPASVYIEGLVMGDRVWSGSGTIIDPNGIILTARHVVNGIDGLKITLQDGRKFNAISWHKSDTDDCAIIRIKAKNLPYAHLANSDRIQIGERCFIIGSPYGYDHFNNITAGIVSGLNRNIPFFGKAPLLQIDAQAWPGNSGGGVFNANGKLIGILVGGKYSYDGFSLCTTSNTIMKMLKNVKSN